MGHKNHGWHSTKAWQRAKRSGRARHIARMMRRRVAAVNRQIRDLYEQWRADHPWVPHWRSPQRLLADRHPLLASHPDPIPDGQTWGPRHPGGFAPEPMTPEHIERLAARWDQANSDDQYVNLGSIAIRVDGSDGQPLGYLIPQSAQDTLVEKLMLLRPPVRSMPDIAPTLTYRDLVAMFPPPVSPEVAQREAERQEILRIFGIPPDLVSPRYAKIAPIQEDVPDGPPQDA